MGIIDQLKEEEAPAPQPAQSSPMQDPGTASPAGKAQPMPGEMEQVTPEMAEMQEQAAAPEGGEGGGDDRLKQIMEQIHQKAMEDPEFKRQLSESNLPEDVLEALIGIDADAGEVIGAIIGDASLERRVLKAVYNGGGALPTELQAIASKIQESGEINRGGPAREPMDNLDAESSPEQDDAMDQKLMGLLGKR